MNPKERVNGTRFILSLLLHPEGLEIFSSWVTKHCPHLSPPAAWEPGSPWVWWARPPAGASLLPADRVCWPHLPGSLHHQDPHPAKEARVRLKGNMWWRWGEVEMRREKSHPNMHTDTRILWFSPHNPNPNIHIQKHTCQHIPLEEVSVRLQDNIGVETKSKSNMYIHTSN